MAMPVIQGVKTASERFAGAVETYCIEALMQDGKALQSGTSHFLGQNFARVFDVKFVNKENQLEYAWATSWVVSTRLMGALVMAHSDDNGLVLPPKLAPIQVVIVPIHKTEEDLAKIGEAANKIADELKAAGVSVKYDDDDKQRSGWKFAEYELRGVPVRLGIGMRDLENGTVEVARRDTLSKESVPLEGVVETVRIVLEQMQQSIYQKALQFREQNTHIVDSWDEFRMKIEDGGFLLAHWDGTAETEEKIKQETKATIRCIPLNSNEEAGKCVYSGQDSAKRVVFARAY
jgi:prolyl-tRNA synthetase